MTREMYNQCELTRRVEPDGVARMVSWIPSKIAVVDATVDLKDSETGEWTRGWTVLNVTEPALPLKLLDRQSRDYRRTRDASDI